MKYKAGFRPAELLDTCDNMWRPLGQFCSRGDIPNLDDAYQAAALGTLPQPTPAVYDNPSDIESHVPGAGCIYDGMLVPGGMPVFMGIADADDRNRAVTCMAAVGRDLIAQLVLYI